MRIIAAAIVGGLIVFIWSAIAHMVTPLGTAGISSLPEEEPVLQAFRANIPKSGLYRFPGGDTKNMTPEQKQAWEAKIVSGPSGLLAYTAEGKQPMSPRQFVSELVSNMLAAAVAAILLSYMSAPYVTKVAACALLALFAFLSLSVSYWTWDNFPTAFVTASLITEFVGWLLAGLAIAKIVTPKSAV